MSLLRAAPEDVLRVWPVDKKVGNVRNDGPELLEPRQLDDAPLLSPIKSSCPASLLDLITNVAVFPDMNSNPKIQDEPNNAIKDPDEWTTGDETMTGAQASYLKTLCDEAGENFDPSLTKSEASKRIDELQERTGRGRTH
jgi:hypothetical protein